MWELLLPLWTFPCLSVFPTLVPHPLIFCCFLGFSLLSVASSPPSACSLLVLVHFLHVIVWSHFPFLKKIVLFFNLTFLFQIEIFFLQFNLFEVRVFTEQPEDGSCVEDTETEFFFPYATCWVFPRSSLWSEGPSGLPEAVGMSHVTRALGTCEDEDPAPEQLKLLAPSFLPTSTAASTPASTSHHWLPKDGSWMSNCRSCCSPGCPVSSSAFITSSRRYCAAGGCPFCLPVSHLSPVVPLRCWGEGGGSFLPSHGTAQGSRCPLPGFLAGPGLESVLERTESDDSCGFFPPLGTRLSSGFAFLSVSVGTSTLQWGLCGWDLHARGHTQPLWLSIVLLVVAFPVISMSRSCFEMYS